LKSEKNEESARELLRRYGNLGLEMVVSVMIGTLGGYGLDWWLGTSPWFLLIGFFFGAAAGFLNIVRLIASEEKRERGKEEP
jgi:ATP synthase protein I